MQHDRVIKQALADVQDLLWANSQSSRRLSDHLAIACLRKVFDRPDVKRAVEHGNDTLCAFALRGVNRIVSDDEQPPRAMLNGLRSILRDPDLGQALGLKQNARINLWLKKPPAR